jgi:Flp pilus assembly protein protease CpaA
MHLVILSILALISIHDMRTQIIADRISLPLIVIIALFLAFWQYVPLGTTLLPSPLMAFAGAVVGMLFYMAQMILPAILAVIHRKTYRDLVPIMLSPILFPAWIITKAIRGEKRADALFPSLSIFDDMPAWVGGGDIRLGCIVGALVGPYDFVYVILYGYIAGTLYFILKWAIFHVRLQTMPVAPLLFVGICLVWCLRIL